VESIFKKLEKLKARKIFIQFPEGLKPKIKNISKELEKRGFDVVMCLEPCYGSCDVRDYEAKLMKCDAILHIGHADFGLKSKIPVVYWEYFYDVDPCRILDKNFNILAQFHNIGLITSVQFVLVMKKVNEYLEKKGKRVFVHKALKYPGQILGCDVRAAKYIEDKVDCFLYVGSGKFHPLGVSLETEKTVFFLDLEKQKIVDMKKDKMKWLRKKAWINSQLQEAHSVGIVVSWKKGQNRIDEARVLKRKLEKKGKEVFILAFDRITEEKLEGLKFDALVNMACPRMNLPISDAKK